MPNYKIVDADKLDNDLQSIADKLKEKAGTTEPLSFPGGFIEVADSIQGGGDDTLLDSLIDRSIASIVNTTLTAVGANAFRNCSKLGEADFGAVTSIAANGFTSCSALATLILRSDTVCTLANTNAFTGTDIASGIGYIYVPSDLVTSYKSATNWSTYADQITAIVED